MHLQVYTREAPVVHGYRAAAGPDATCRPKAPRRRVKRLIIPPSGTIESDVVKRMPA